MKLPRLQTTRCEGKQFEDAASWQSFYFIPNLKRERNKKPSMYVLQSFIAAVVLMGPYYQPGQLIFLQTILCHCLLKHHCWSYVSIIRRCKKRADLPNGWIWWEGRGRWEGETHTLHFPWRAVWDFQSSALTHKILRTNFQLHLCHFHYHSTRPEVIMDSVNCSLFPSQTTRAFTWGQVCTRGGPDIC